MKIEEHLGLLAPQETWTLNSRIRSKLGFVDKSVIFDAMVLQFVSNDRNYWTSSENPEIIDARLNTWNADLSLWNEKVARYGAPKYGCSICRLTGVEEGSFYYGDIIMPGYSLPNEIAFLEAEGSYVSDVFGFDKMMESYEAAREKASSARKARAVIIVVDNNHAYEQEPTFKIEPGYSEFIEWLNSEGIGRATFSTQPFGWLFKVKNMYCPKRNGFLYSPEDGWSDFRYTSGMYWLAYCRYILPNTEYGAVPIL